jgi:DNA-binding LacI/PurR family transcriptional regulator
LARTVNLRQNNRKMRARHRKRTILLAITSTHHGFYHGAARYAAEHDWHIVADMIYDPTIPFGWKGDGILSFVGHWEELAKWVVSARIPVVEISSVRKDLGLPCVMEDNAGIGRLGAEHLLERNLKNFVWTPFGMTLLMRNDLKDLPILSVLPDLTASACCR